MPRLYPLPQAKPKILRKLLQLFQLSLHIINQKLKLGPQVILHTVPKYRRDPPTHSRRFLVLKPYALEEPHLRSQLLHPRVEHVRVRLARSVQILHPQLLEVNQRRSQAVLHVGEEDSGAVHDQSSGFRGGGSELAGEEVEDGICFGDGESR